jgi:hypothetical protein
VILANDDLFDEHLNNPKSIKEILTDALTLSMLEPQSFLLFLRTTIGDILQTPKQ